jgi:hypothetical protein
MKLVPGLLTTSAMPLPTPADAPRPTADDHPQGRYLPHSRPAMFKTMPKIAMAEAEMTCPTQEQPKLEERSSRFSFPEGTICAIQRGVLWKLG